MMRNMSQDKIFFHLIEHWSLVKFRSRGNFEYFFQKDNNHFSSMKNITKAIKMIWLYLIENDVFFQISFAFVRAEW